jgi:glutathione S-transferase
MIRLTAIDPWVALVTLASLLVYFATCVAVGLGRARHGVAAPAMTGHPAFERAVRVQMNTLEWLPIYLPSLWLFAVYLDPRIAASLGVVWIVGRVLYMTAYLNAAENRGPGFAIQALAALILLLGAIGGAVWSLLRPHG